jgi:site-specific recombinase XerD
MNAIIKYPRRETHAAILQAGHDSLSPATRKAYETDLSGFYKATGKDIPAATVLDITHYIKTLDQAGYKNATINRKLYSISKIFGLYKLAGLIDRNPIAELNQVKRITRATSKQINAQVTLDDLHAIAHAGRTAVIITTLAHTGLRISELIGIKHGDIEDHHEGGKEYKRVRIIGKGNKERFIYLSGDLFTTIKATFAVNSDYLFHSDTGKVLNRVNLHKQIKGLFRRLTGKDIHPHSLRHFFATHKITAEKQDIKAVSKYLGHSGTSITLDMYVDTALTAEKAVLLHN